MMNSTNKLSVIIPLYNAGDDFRTCMESLITQTWTALEIIIINDGSTDNSVEIAKHYAENYPHVRLLHQANAGASVARNRGIEAATFVIALPPHLPDIMTKAKPGYILASTIATTTNTPIRQ